MFSGPLVDVSAEHQPVIEDDEVDDGYITLPQDLDPVIAKAYHELQEAQSRLLRGHYRAAVQSSGDALNRVAAFADIHGYATY